MPRPAQRVSASNSLRSHRPLCVAPVRATIEGGHSGFAFPSHPPSCWPREALWLSPFTLGVKLFEIDDVLDRLAAEAPEVAELVKLRVFAGLTVNEAASALGISRTTAFRHWTYARAWLRPVC